MEPNDAGGGGSKKLLIAGWIVSALPAGLLLFSAAIKFLRPPGFDDGMNRLGWDPRMAVGLGVLEVMCTLVYLLPRTAVLGAILLTAYLGGATATHVRIADAIYGPVGAGVLVWLGLYLRDARVRALVPLRSAA